MAKIENSTPKSSSGGYGRLVGNEAMADLFTKVQSTVISNGTELERLIIERSTTINDLDDFIDKCDKGLIANGVYLCTKKVVKASSYRLDKHEPDFIIFVLNKEKDACYVLELKDGDSFDTKKSVGERESLHAFVAHLAPKIPFRTKSYMCCFNQLDKKVIAAGFKNVFSEDEVMTGKEFCTILGIDYDALVKLRNKDTKDNFEYVVEKMSEIPELQKKVIQQQQQIVAESEFYDDDEE